MSNERSAFWDQMYQSGKVSKKQFSLCFSRHDYVDPYGTPAGAMTIGGYDPRLHIKPMVFASDESGGSGFFTVHLKNIYLKETSTDKDMVMLPLDEITLNSRGVIVDSGTTDTYFMNVIGGPFKAAWKAMTGKDYTNDGSKMTKSDILSLPTVVLQLKGVSETFYIETYGSVPSTGMLVGEALDPNSPFDILVHIPPWHYMEYDPDNDLYTPRMYLDESSGTVLGANTMQGHDVFFDMENGHIGFAESDCRINDIPSTTSSSKTEVDDFKAEMDYEFLKQPEDDIESIAASWSCGTSQCRSYFSFVAVVLLGGLVIGIFLYRRNHADTRGIPVQSRDLEFYEDDGEVEIMRSSNRSVV